MNVCQRYLVNEVFRPPITEFVRNFSREDATPIQRSSNASLLVRIWAVKLIRHSFERHALRLTLSDRFSDAHPHGGLAVGPRKTRKSGL